MVVDLEPMVDSTRVWKVWRSEDAASGAVLLYDIPDAMLTRVIRAAGFTSRQRRRSSVISRHVSVNTPQRRDQSGTAWDIPTAQPELIRR